MRRDRVTTMFAIRQVLLGFALLSATQAKPKGSAGSCTTKDLNTNFGGSCNAQMQQDIMQNKPYLHVLLCGGDTMLCCTVENQTNQVLNCRKPVESRVKPGLQNPQMQGSVLSRGVEGKEAGDEVTPIPSWLTDA